MDSLTQIVLGAAVGEVILGKKLGNRAIFWGAVAGTIPDLDVLLNFVVSDKMSGMLMHRAFSHSFLFAFLMAPIFGYLLTKLFVKKRNIYIDGFVKTPKLHRFLSLNNKIHTFFFRKSKANFRDWTLLFFWGFLTHILLDVQTTYGTQLLWPFHNRLATSNVFVVDPFYTIPFLIFVIMVMFYKRTNPKRTKINRIGLYISTGYLVLTFLIKFYTFQKFTENLKVQNISYNRIETGPTPLNAILWFANVETDDYYYIGYYSLFDKDDTIFYKKFKKNHVLRNQLKDYRNFKRMNRFSKDWYLLNQKNDSIYYSNVRFGTFGFKNEDRNFVYDNRLEILENDIKFKVSNRNPSENMDSEPYVKNFFKHLLERVLGNK